MSATADALMAVFGMRRVRTRKCAVCREPFQPRSMTHKACGPHCAEALAIKAREKTAAKALQARKDALKRRRDHLADAQVVFNEFIRLRDAVLPCISCGRFHQGQYHAGHYRSIGAAAHLRYNEDNVHRQCAPCNNHKSGNILEYRIGLIARIGQERVAALETNNEVRRWTIDDARLIKAEYRAKIKTLKAAA